MFLELFKEIENNSTPEPNSGCWLWTSKTRPDGYGQLYWPYIKRTINASRASYFAFHKIKNLPKEKFICHKCNTKGCVNPSHLYLGTAKTNSQDMIKAGTSYFTEKHGKKTHCDSGHEFNADNTYKCKDGERHCRKCKALTELKRIKRIRKTKPKHIWARKVCKRGHDVTGANGYRHAMGIHCRKCRARRDLKNRERTNEMKRIRRARRKEEGMAPQ